MKVKKIAALAVGAAMVGATIGFASAQPSVPNIPKEFFVKDGQPNVKIVVGSQGAAQDVAGAADIAVAIGSLLYTEKDVSIEDASVVVKKDVAYDPEDIPVASYYHVGYEYPSKNFPTNKWWNGSWVPHYPKKKTYYSDVKITFSPSYTGVDGGVWSDGVLNQSEIHPYTTFKVYNGTATVNATYYDNPMKFTVYDSLYWKPVKPVPYKIGNKVVDRFDGGYVLDYNVNIKTIKFDNKEWSDWVKDYGKIPPRDIKLVIPKNSVNVTIDYKLGGYKYTTYGCAGVAHTTYYIDDGIGDKVLREGALVGDVIDIFGNKLEIVDMKTPNFLGDDKTYTIVFGKNQGAHYINKGEAMTFGNYTVKVLDIDVNKVKALFEVSGPEGTEIVTLDTDKDTDTPNATVLFNGAIRIKLLDTFIGIGGTTSAQIQVWTDLFGVQDSDDSIYEGWTVHFDVKYNSTAGYYYLDKIWLTNNKNLEGDQITLFDKFVVDYKSKVCSETDSHDHTYYTVKAWVAIDPLKPEYTTKTLEVGDELDDWIVDKIEATPNPAKAAVPGEVKPVTVLDTEIMAEGLDKVDSNLILVGGPVVNKVTAALAEELGVPANYTGWKEKFGTGKESGVVKYLAKCAAINDHGVVLVAGTDREGTKAAAEALMEYIASLS